MADPIGTSARIDGLYNIPSIVGFYDPYDLCVVFYVTINQDGDLATHLADVTTDAGVALTLPFFSLRPRKDQRWRAIRTKRGDQWLDDWISGGRIGLDFTQQWFDQVHVTEPAIRPTTSVDFKLDIIEDTRELHVEVQNGAFVTLTRDGADISGSYAGPAANVLTAGWVGVDPNDYYLAAGANVYRLTNPATNIWVLQGSTGFTVRFMAGDPTDSAVIYAASIDGNLAKSADGGQNWTALTSVPLGLLSKVKNLWCPSPGQLVTSVGFTPHHFNVLQIRES